MTPDEDGMTDAIHEKDVAFIRALAELLRENDLTELQVKREYGSDDSLNVRVSRQTHLSSPPPVPHAPQPAAPAMPTTAPEGASPAEPTLHLDDPAHHPGAVTSPMVGTVYLQAEPGSEPFIRIGQKMSEGETLLIIEAMKTMNHIPAPRSGTIRQILVEDGAPVEFGAPLVILE